MNPWRLLPILCCFSCSAPALAMSATYDRCIASIDHEALVNTQTQYCAVRDMDRADLALNQTYRRVMAKLSPPRRMVLRCDERAWIDARHRACLPTGEVDAMPPETIRMLCLVEQTDRRTAYLARLEAER